MSKNDTIMKWIGSKRSQSENIVEYFPKIIDKYFEPFCGGASVLLQLLKTNIKVNEYIISDINKELIGIYNLIINDPQLLINIYYKHWNEFNSSDIQHRKDYFNQVRAEFNRSKKPEDFFFITRSTTNGLIRYNSKGEFNNSCHFSRPSQNPKSIEKMINEHSILFKSKNIKFIHQSYEEINPGINDLVYCDCPYESIKGNSMYFGKFDNGKYFDWINGLNGITKWIMSYDGKAGNTEEKHEEPTYIRKTYLKSGNSSLRRVIGNSNDTIVFESLYLNF